MCIDFVKEDVFSRYTVLLSTSYENLGTNDKEVSFLVRLSYEHLVVVFTLSFDDEYKSFSANKTEHRKRFPDEVLQAGLKYYQEGLTIKKSLSRI